MKEGIDEIDDESWPPIGVMKEGIDEIDDPYVEFAPSVERRYQCMLVLNLINEQRRKEGLGILFEKLMIQETTMFLESEDYSLICTISEQNPIACCTVANNKLYTCRSQHGISASSLSIYDVATLKRLEKNVTLCEDEKDDKIWELNSMDSNTILAFGNRLSHNQEMIMWDVDDDNEVKIRLMDEEGIEQPARIEGHFNGTRCMAYHEASGRLFSSGSGDPIKVWSMPDTPAGPLVEVIDIFAEDGAEDGYEVRALLVVREYVEAYVLLFSGLFLCSIVVLFHCI